MRGLFRLVMLVIVVIGGYYFVQQWRSVTPWGVQTGKISGVSRDLPARDKRPVTEKVASPIREITENPTRFENKKVTVTGRVRGAAKYASNRNIYMLTADEENKILVIDDKKPPDERWPRTVKGTVKVIGPPVGGLQYAYIVDVKEGVKFTPPRWDQVQHYFSDKYGEMKQGVKETVNSR